MAREVIDRKKRTILEKCVSDVLALSDANTISGFDRRRCIRPIAIDSHDTIGIDPCLASAEYPE